MRQAKRQGTVGMRQARRQRTVGMRQARRQGTVGIRQVRRQPIRGKRPRLFCTAVEGWLRQRLIDGKDDYCNEVILMPTALS
jgi:hypothetical protein